MSCMPSNDVSCPSESFRCISDQDEVETIHKRLSTGRKLSLFYPNEDFGSRNKDRSCLRSRDAIFEGESARMIESEQTMGVSFSVSMCHLSQYAREQELAVLAMRMISTHALDEQ